MDANEIGEIDEVVQEFLLESWTNLDQLDDQFLELERDPEAGEVLASIFRTIHTIKGTAGFLGFERLGELTHAGESLLSRLRSGELRLNQPRTTALLSLVDTVRVMLATIEAVGSEGADDHDAVLAALNASMVDETGETVETGEAPVADEGRANGARSALNDSSVRIDVALLDNLMNLVGELVLTRNRILQVSATDSESVLHTTAQQLNLVTTELQEEVMRTRLQPIQSIWSRFPRIVRDLALTCGKQVRIEMVGADTELDRTIIEAIRDPLTHMIRNAVDHGLEGPEARVAAGKPAAGTISLLASHEGSQVSIVMKDDGGGIDLGAVGERAVARGVVSADGLARMSDRQITELIFEPGLSTAAQITSLSGRGVGMDVVRSNIEKIGGTVEAVTEVGVGTTMRMKIPLTLAIVPALVVHTGDQPWAIPQVNVIELVRLAGSAGSGSGIIESVGDAKVYRLRGQLLPIVDMRAALGLPGGTDADAGADAGPGDDPRDRAAVNVVVLKADRATFGLIVDHIDHTQEIVVKPLGVHLRDIGIYAGSTVMGDGRVALILDAVGLAKHARVASETIGVAMAPRAAPAVESITSESVLVCHAGGHRIALGLPAITRLEFVPPERIEWSNGGEVTQFHDGRVLRLIRIEELLGPAPGAPVRLGADAVRRVIVCEHGPDLVGLVVDDIVDIAGRNGAEQPVRDEGIVAVSAVVGGQVTDIIDVERVLAAVAAAAVPAAARTGR